MAETMAIVIFVFVTAFLLFFPLFSLQILTKDSVTAQVDAVVYFYVQDPVASILQAENARNSTFRVAQGTLRDVLGTKTLAQILSDRESISEQLGVSSRFCHEEVVYGSLANGGDRYGGGSNDLNNLMIKIHKSQGSI